MGAKRPEPPPIHRHEQTPPVGHTGDPASEAGPMYVQHGKRPTSPPPPPKKWGDPYVDSLLGEIADIKRQLAEAREREAKLRSESQRVIDKIGYWRSVGQEHPGDSLIEGILSAAIRQTESEAT